jgi:hypothetical protein
LRDLDLTLSTTWHPRALDWEARSQAWIKEVLAEAGQDTPVLETCALDALWWACLCYPATIDEPHMADVTRMSICYFLIDDSIYTSYLRTGRIGELMQEFIDAIANPRLRPATFLGRFLADTWHDMTERMSPGLRARWIAATKGYMRGTAREVAARAAGRRVTPEEYRQMRDESMAAAIVHLLGEHSVGIDMTDDIAAHPDLFDRIWDVANAHLLYVNDLFSFRKEYCDGGDFQHSLIYTGVTVDGLTLQQSVDRLASQVETTECRYRALCQDILENHRGADPSKLHAYLEQLERGLAGSRDYSFIASRYHGRGFAHAEADRYVPQRTSGWLMLQPRRTVFLDPMTTSAPPTP